MRLRWRPLAAGVVAAGLCACATPPPRPVAPGKPTLLDAAAADVAKAAESLSGRPREDVIAALGPATVVRFDSGYEIWVYRFAEPSARKPTSKPDKASAAERDDSPSELVMLLTPAGLVAKVRIRLAST